MELAPEVATLVRDARPRDDARFTKGAIKAAVDWAVEASGPARGFGAVTRARVVALAIDGDPPTLVAELAPGNARLALRATEFPTPRWTLMGVLGPGEDVPTGLPERSLTFSLPATAGTRPALDWMASALAEVAAFLGMDVTAPDRLETQRWHEELGQGETRTVQRRVWTHDHAHVEVEEEGHEIYDGATPASTAVRGSVTGLAGGPTIILSAALRAEEQPTARLFVTGPRHLIDRIQAPTGEIAAASEPGA